MAKMKVYFLPNWGGTHYALVAAPNQKEAARLMGCSLNGFKAYGGQVVTDEERVTLALSEPGVVWKRKMEYGKDKQPWVREGSK